MSQFLLKLSLFVGILTLAIVSVGIFNRSKVIPSDYAAAIIDKHKLITTVPSPRLILAGGSNLTFGIDSKALEKKMRIPVINLSLHAGLGLSFILNELKYSIKQNDIVFLSIEYFLGSEGIYDLQTNASEYFPEASLYYRKNYYYEFKKYLERQKKLFKNSIMPQIVYTDSIYSRSAFNSNGDITSHLTKKAFPKLKDRWVMKSTSWEGVDLINDFYKFAQTKNVKVFFLFPNYPESEYKVNKEVILDLEKELRQQLKAPVLNKPSDFVYPDSCFFDTIYHLNGIGRDLRTQKLISILDKCKIYIWEADTNLVIHKSKR